MPEVMPEDEDSRLGMLFREAAVPVADDGFTAAVMHRVARRAWHRRVVLGAAGAVGCVIAFQPAWNIAGMLSHDLALFGNRWTELTWLLQTPLTIAAGLLLIAGPSLWRWLAD